jgi:two-component system chemotaxis sensor kinase CheA
VANASAREYFIVLVDDDSRVLDSISDMLVGLDSTCKLFLDPVDSADFIASNVDSVVLVISDLQMPRMDGFEFRERVAQISKDTPFAFLSGHFNLDLARKAMATKVISVLEKPIGQSDLLNAVRSVVSERRKTLEEKAIIKEIFVNETCQILEELEPLILDLEQDPNNVTAVNDVFRLVHTIKGSSSFLENASLPKYAHLLENVLSDLKSGKREITEEIVSVLLEALDVLKQMTSTIESGEPQEYDVEELGKIFVQCKSKAKAAGVQPAAGDEKVKKQPQKNAEKDFLRVPIRTLDEFMELSGEITIVRNVVNKLVKSLEKHFPANKDLSLVSEMLEEMYKSQSRMVSNVLDMRKVPLFDVFRPFNRMVRDLCRNLSKDVNLKIIGESLRVDTSLGKVIGDSLVHIIRNSMDHGIEAAEERTKLGKSAEGKITVNCFENRDEIVIEVKDDGRGLNLTAIKEKGIERGLITYEEASQISDQRLMQLIFEPGFSTAKKVTDVSGRGVGMDMVKTSVDAIGGHVEVTSERGKGSAFELRLPIPKSVLIISVVLVRESDRVFAFPQDRIEHLLQFEASRSSEFIREMQQSRFLIRDDKLIPLIRLGEVLRLDSPKEKIHSEVNIVVVRDDRIHFAIEVDVILDSEEVVVKPLSQVLSGLTCYAGATLVGVGDVCVIIDYEGAAALAGIDKISAGDIQRHGLSKGVAAASTERDFVLYRFADNDTVYASRCDTIYRLEHLNPAEVHRSGRTPVVHYRDRIMPLIDTSDMLGLGSRMDEMIANGKELPILVVQLSNSYFGFCVSEFVDVLFVSQQVDRLVRDRAGIEGNLFLNNVNYPVLVLQDLLPSQFHSALQPPAGSGMSRTVEAEPTKLSERALIPPPKHCEVSSKPAEKTAEGGSEEAPPTNEDGIYWAV